MKRYDYLPLSTKELRNEENWKHRDTWTLSNNALVLRSNIYFKGKLYFVAQKSQIEKAGFGLYAARDFKKNQVIAYYEGRVIVEKKDSVYDQSVFLQSYGNQDFDTWINTNEGSYVMRIKDKWIDGSKDNFNGTRFINDAYKTNFKNNLKLNTNGGFKTLKNIKEGEELFFQYSYRNTYWNKRKVSYK